LGIGLILEASNFKSLALYAQKIFCFPKLIQRKEQKVNIKVANGTKTVHIQTTNRIYKFDNNDC
tara:strand:- start:103 stop:294 length:192 start_codon:yes stop_codon:yes gene_type:complete